MDFDEDDNLLVTHIRSGFIDIYAPNGGKNGDLLLNEQAPVNIHGIPEKVHR
jgi:hypothetical protein